MTTQAQAPYVIVAIACATLVRAGITSILSGQRDLTLAGIGESLAAGTALISRGRPAVVLIDIELPDGDALAYGAELRLSHPGTGVVVLGHGDRGLFRALDAGISAYVPHSAPVSDLLDGIRHAAVTPGSFTAPDLAAAILRQRQRTVALSPRETEVLDMSVAGLSVAQISSALRVRESTVKTYLSRAYDKLGGKRSPGVRDPGRPLPGWNRDKD